MALAEDTALQAQLGLTGTSVERYESFLVQKTLIVRCARLLVSSGVVERVHALLADYLVRLSAWWCLLASKVVSM